MPESGNVPLFKSTGDEHIDAVLTTAIGVTSRYATPKELDDLRQAVKAWGEVGGWIERWPSRYTR